MIRSTSMEIKYRKNYGFFFLQFEFENNFEETLLEKITEWGTKNSEQHAAFDIIDVSIMKTGNNKEAVVGIAYE